MPTLRIGTRGSRLALAQSTGVQADLQRLHPGLTVELCVIKTTGDRQVDRPLAELGGKGLFTAELEDALREGRIDLAVHSLKDLPVELPPGLVLGAVPTRVSPADVLVHRTGLSVRVLPPGTVLGTSSPRRILSLQVSSPHLRFRELRGNVDTRLRKLDAGEVDGLVMAHAGLLRLGLDQGRVVEPLPLLTLIPAPGQGALGIEARAGDQAVLDRLAPLHDPVSALETSLERGLLQALGGGCRMALGANARAGKETVRLTAALAGADGRRLYRTVCEARIPDAPGLVLTAAAALRAQGAPIEVA